MRQRCLSQALCKSIAQRPVFFATETPFIDQMAHFWAVAPHFMIHLRHEDVLPPESLWQLAQGTHDINVKSGWISDNKWYENIARFGLIRSKKKKRRSIWASVWQTAPWHVSLAAHFACDKTNLEGGRSNINNSGFSHKRNLFDLFMLSVVTSPGSPSKMWNISGKLRTKVVPASFTFNFVTQD